MFIRQILELKNHRTPGVTINQEALFKLLDYFVQKATLMFSL